jgi:hypothetical protein
MAETAVAVVMTGPGEFCVTIGEESVYCVDRGSDKTSTGRPNLCPDKLLLGRWNKSGLVNYWFSNCAIADLRLSIASF